MKKWIIFYVFTLSSMSFSIVPLAEMAFKVSFDHKEWKINKEKLKPQINRLPADLIKGQTIIGLDFSNLNLTGKDLSNCKFFKVNFEGADLTDTTLSNTHFDRCNLVGAVFRYSINGSEKVFKVEHNDHYKLVKQYSDLMKKKEEKEETSCKEEAEDFAKQAGCLNHLFGALKLDLIDKDLKNFHLIDINLQNASLLDAQLQGARLSKDFKVPFYNHPINLFDQFKEAVNNNTPDKQYFLKLVQNEFHIFNYISHDRLNQMNWEGLDLRNSNLFGANLQGINLNGTNLKGANLSSADLRGASLIKTKLENTNLYGVQLEGAQFSENFQLDSTDFFKKWYEANKNDTYEKKYYNRLVASRFYKFKKEDVLLALEAKLSLRNADLKCAELNNIKLLNIDLENTIMSYSRFNGSTLTNVNFKNSKLWNACFEGINTKLEKVNFTLSNLNTAKFTQAALKSVSFQRANLSGADFTGAILEDVDFFAADISCMALADKVTLPNSNNDLDHIKFYHSCAHPEAKALLKIILESRDINLDNVVN